MKRRSIAGGKPAKTPRRTIVPQKQRSSPKRLRGRNPSSGQETEVERLRRELNEAVEQQKATTDVLRVISSSPGQLEPIFRAMLEDSVRILEAKFGTLFLCEGNLVRPVAGVRLPPKLREFQAQRGAFVPPPGLPLARLIETKKVIHMLDDPERLSPATKLGGARSHIAVPMLKEGKIVGAIYIYRQEVKPFTDKQIALVQNFAAQAVIAIENARLLDELRGALERQTATSEVLQVISGSPGDLEPVFAAMLESAVRTCGAKFGNIYRVEDGGLSNVATHNTPTAFAEALRSSPYFSPGPNNPVRRMMQTKTIVHVLDVAASEAYAEREPITVASVELGETRTLMIVPMLKDNELAGAFTLARQEVRPFTDKQIELVQNFAAQAVIAIENTRLLNELRRSLEQQTATSEVLQVISSSPGALQPVFDAMLTNATRLCEASFGILLRYENAAFHVAASHNAPPAFVELRRREPTIRASGVLRRVVGTKQLLHISDCLEDASYKHGDADFVRFVDLCGARSFIAAPMLKDDELVGTITVFHQEVRPFTEKQIALVTNFAAQAVIAIENARLLDELRQRTTDLTERTADLTEALEQQTAMSEVLQVISASPSELQPVFATMLEKAVRICDATFGNVYRWDSEALHLVATHNTPPAFAEARRQSLLRRDGGNQMLTRILATKTPVHVVDAAALPGYIDRSDLPAVQTVELGGIRTLLAVPMLKEGELIGGFTVYRQEVRPFTDKQIDLVKNFAAQAVIAIENARLLNELRQSLEQQTASSDVLKIISTSQGDLQPVFEAMVDNATRICQASLGTLTLYENGGFRHVALHRAPAAYRDLRAREPFVKPHPAQALGRLASTKKVVHVTDVMAEPEPARGELFRLAGARTLLIVPMLKDEELLGAIGIYRQEVKPFSEEQINLLKNFANQAVIAIENARLLNELRQRTTELTQRTTDLTERTADLTEALGQQTATSEVLHVISVLREK